MNHRNPAPASVRIQIPTPDELMEKYLRTDPGASMRVGAHPTIDDMTFFGELVQAVYEAMPDDVDAEIHVSVPARPEPWYTEGRPNVASIKLVSLRSPFTDAQRIRDGYPSHRITFEATRNDEPSRYVIVIATTRPPKRSEGRGAKGAMDDAFLAAGWVSVPHTGRRSWGPPKALMEMMGLERINPWPVGPGGRGVTDLRGIETYMFLRVPSEGFERMWVGPEGSCEVDGCERPASTCTCGNSHCDIHPHADTPRENPPHRTRDEGGKYDYDKMALLCVCGHTLGEHSGVKPRECRAVACGSSTVECVGGDCLKFRKARVQSNPPPRQPSIPSADALLDIVRRRGRGYGGPEFSKTEIEAFVDYCLSAWQSLPDELREYMSSDWLGERVLLRWSNDHVHVEHADEDARGRWECVVSSPHSSDSIGAFATEQAAENAGEDWLIESRNLIAMEGDADFEEGDEDDLGYDVYDLADADGRMHEPAAVHFMHAHPDDVERARYVESSDPLYEATPFYEAILRLAYRVDELRATGRWIEDTKNSQWVYNGTPPRPEDDE